ncbi:MAG: T9SS type B sorting domain-containing protein [Chitinophagaceae bacterium]
MKIILHIFFTLLSINCIAGPISGNTSVSPGSVETYTVTWDAWNSTYENYANVTWNVTGGSVINSDKHSVTIQWNTLEGYLDGSGSIDVSEDLGGQSSQQSITIVNNTESPSEFCNGSLGQAGIAVDFGSGNNPGPPLPNGTTTYQYNASCSLLPGEYTVVNNSNLCRSLWHNIPQDHTGNANGYFLMVNANDGRNEIYRTTVSGLTTAFRYEFSAWVGNLYNNTGGQDPNIRFEIYDLSGNLLKSSGTIRIPVTLPTFQWQKVGFMFDIPPGNTSVQVVIVNTRRSTDNQGNDMVIDDISFAPCYPPIAASFSTSSIIDRAHICNNGTVNLYASWPSTIPFQNPAYQWQRSTDNGFSWSDIPGANSINYVQTENSPGIYQYRMFSYETSNPSQSVLSNIIIYYVQLMTVEAKTTNIYACSSSPSSEQLVGLYNLQYSDPAESLSFTYLWSPSTYISNPYVNPSYISLPPAQSPPPPNGPPQPAINYYYTLTVTNTNYGCSASNTQTVSLYNPRKVHVPSAFTPNGDGLNDFFYPINIEDYPGAKFWVYNRFGQVVFYSQGPATREAYSWDGKFNGIPQGSAVFPWIVEIPGCPSNIYSASDGEGKSKGTVTLIR